MRIFIILLCLFFHSHSCAENDQAYLRYPTIFVNEPVKTWKSFRDDSIEKQDEDFSCGSAAVATILRFFYGKEIYEKDILKEVIRVGDDGAASFSDLEKSVKKFGFKAIGLTLDFEQLKQLKIPIVVYLRYRTKDHFSVIKGINQRNGLVSLADPSWGNRKFSERRFKAMWESRDDHNLKGKILMIVPKNKKMALNNSFFVSPRQNNTGIKLLAIHNTAQ